MFLDDDINLKDEQCASRSDDNEVEGNPIIYEVKCIPKAYHTDLGLKRSYDLYRLKFDTYIID